MATYLWSALANNAQLNSFDPESDVLLFDDPSISAAAITVQQIPDAATGAVQYGYLGKTITIRENLFQVTSENVQFADTSYLRVGDDTTETAYDNTGGALNGYDTADQLVAGAGGYVLTGNAGNDKLLGGADADTLDAGAGQDTLVGGGGDDILDGGSEVDSMAGGAGDDIYYVDETADTVTELPGAGADIVFSTEDYTLSANVETLVLDSAFGRSGIGNATDNVIIGTAGDDILEGRGGDDVLEGGDGNDTLTGGAGADFLNGEGGIDTVRYDTAATGVVVDLFAESGSGGEAAGDTYNSIERIIGSQFDDTLRGNDNDNDVIGNDGDDALTGHGGDDNLQGGNGDDQLFGGEGADMLDGGAGNNTARYDFGGSVTANLANASANTGDAQGDTYVSINNLTGSQFDDVLAGDNAANVISGNDGDDHLLGALGRDTLSAGGGNDILEGGADGDALDGGDGTDLVTYENSGGVVADMLTPSTNTGEAAGDSYLSIENLLGSAFADTLAGDNAANEIQAADGNDVLNGNGGDDTLIAGNGNDVLIGGAGADVLNGGAGFDTVSFETALAGVVVDLAGDRIMTGDAIGDDIFSVEGITGSSLGDELYGDANGNVLQGLTGNDVLSGNAGADYLLGGSGDDTLDGQEGADLMQGDAGSDIFLLLRSEANGDTILDFTGGDHLQFKGYGSPADGASFLQVDATHWSINSDDGSVQDVVTIANGVPLTSADYTFI
jgi:Ca2+-binding RTX toxin-like protein